MVEEVGTSGGFRPIDRGEHELLIVNDDPASRYATARQLRAAGFRTREAATGMEGLQAADEGISAMVLDIHLPDIDGFELCRMLRARPATARLPVLHLSAAYGTSDDKVRGLDAGADAYLTHPVEPEVLIATVQALVRTRVAEEAMRRSESKFRAIYAHAPGGICLLDGSGRIAEANPAMLALLGRGLDGVAGRAISEFVPPEWAAAVDAFVADGPGMGGKSEFPLLTPQGQQVHIELTVSKQVDPSGASLAIATDISQRMLLQRQREELLERESAARGAAERLNRMKDELIAVLSHELRTPLNAIMGWAHVLKKSAGGAGEAARGLEAIERNGKIQARIISDILDMSRLNLGKMPLMLETVDPAEVVASALNAMRPSMEENGLELVVEMAPPYRPIRADSSRLQQVVWNLLSNAIKFSGHGGEIRVRLREDDQGLNLTVADQGQGIAAEFLPFLFDRFTQSDAGSNRQRGGLGLGLSIVKQLIEAHGGSVAAASEGPGRGTEFTVRLPAGSAPRPAAPANEADPDTAFDDVQPRDAADGSIQGLRLLVVDDDPEACAILQIILSDRGASVALARDVDAALGLLDNRPIDLVISDIGMPGNDGYGLIREIRRREAGTAHRLPAIALTSFTREQDRGQALAAGFDDHCPKPLRPLQLVEKVVALSKGSKAPKDRQPAAPRGG